MNQQHLWIKICGIRDVPTALAVAECGADAIGLNFYDQSPRCVDTTSARGIVESLPSHVSPVGLFVNHSIDEIRRIATTCGITTVQLHGDEPASMIGELSDYRVIRALRTDGDFASLASQQMNESQQVGAMPWAWLVDSRSPHAYGGTGETVDWEPLAHEQRSPEWPPLVLAGGLTPENVADAVRTVQPWGIDVASGVESSPGVKDLEMVKVFISRARAAS
ncbi:MAG: phosphoribosylanthranilate isomerase [Planctomycetaceae bacterium]|nr:phosphoribosylanthranilate isomerase [Planctomycetaceae bacterium]